MQRKLASIQTVLSVEPIEGSDFIEKIKVLGWQCVARKGEFGVGEPCCYIEVDSMLPIKPEFEFLRKSCYRKMHTGQEGFRIKTVTLRKTLSQGIALPLNSLPVGNYCEGQDVTDLLGVFKYEYYIPPSISGEVWGRRPHFVPLTDEMRIQSYPKLLEEIKGKRVYRSIKLDGCSMSVYFNPNEERKFGVCSREMDLKETEGNTLWKIVNRYGLKEKLNGYAPIVLQGELCGPGIQKNRLNLLDHDWFIFDVWFPDRNRYASLEEMIVISNDLGLKTVPIETTYDSFNFTQDELLSTAEGKYQGTENQREGNVWRPTEPCYSETLNGRLSFKVLNNKFLLKED